MTHKGPVLNPVNKEHSAGGSSSGSGVVVATGEADMAIGEWFIFSLLLFDKNKRTKENSFPTLFLSSFS